MSSFQIEATTQAGRKTWVCETDIISFESCKTQEEANQLVVDMLTGKAYFGAFGVKSRVESAKALLKKALSHKACWEEKNEHIESALHELEMIGGAK